MKVPEISVVMSVYNGAQYLRETIDSILEQTFSEYEFIIIDDGSEDDTEKILKSYTDKRIHIISQENRGLAPSLNRGIKEASGALIARIDAGDIATIDRLEQQFNFLEQHPDYVLIGGFLDIITASGKFIYTQKVPTGAKEIYDFIKKGSNPFLHPSVTYRRSPAIVCGMYNENLAYSEDRDFYKRLVNTGCMENLSYSVGQYRIAPGAISNQPRDTLKKWAKLVKKAEVEKLTGEETQFIRNSVLMKDILKDKSLCQLRIGSAYLQHTNDIKSARNYLWWAVKSWKFNWPAWYNLFLTYLSPNTRLTINKFRGHKS
jgi:glycosyltransferase involved in cell wall biosynthesis